MSQVSITVNQRSYRFACSDGEVAHLRDLADHVTRTLERLIAEHGPIGDERLMVMAALTIADELFEARADVDTLLGGEEIQAGAAG